MKPYFTSANTTAGNSQTLPDCNTIRVYSVSGTATLSFNGGSEVPILAGDVFKTDFPAMFKQVKVTATGGDCLLIYGNGYTSNRAFGLATVITANPEGSVAAIPGTTAYNTTDGSYWVKASGEGTT